MRSIGCRFTTLNRSALQDIEGLTNQQKDLCKNSFALGLTYWMFDRPLDQTLGFFEQKFAKRPTVIEANTRSLRAGYYFGETTEAFQSRVSVPRRTALDPGTYRRVTGNEALVMGLVTASKKARRHLVYASYPITPASTILEELAALKNFGVRTFQAEDEIAAMGAAIGAAFGGALAVTASSGPGIALKSEGMNLAVVLELPMVIIDIQRGGPVPDCLRKRNRPIFSRFFSAAMAKARSRFWLRRLPATVLRPRSTRAGLPFAP